MNILADENISPIIVECLRQAGHSVRFVAEIAKGIDDIDVLAFAYEQEEIVLTDDKDFGDLVIFQGRPSRGVILVRLEGVPYIERAEIIVNYISENQDILPGGFSVIKLNKKRNIRLLHESFLVYIV